MALPFSEVKVLDANAAALGVPVERLMENAGRAVADVVAPLAGPSGVVVACGPGNNGGDGFVAARHLAVRGIPVRVLTPLAKGAWKGAAQRACDLLPGTVDVRFGADASRLADALRAPGVVAVDALLGVGIRGSLREPMASFVRTLRDAGARVVSVDVPSGLGTDAAVVPEATVTFHAAKEGLDPARAGKVHVADIGIPREAETHTGPGEYLLYPQGKWDQHKGEGGIVLVIGGGPYTGAPAVAGLAALRAGADLSIILTPEKAWATVAGYSPNLVARPLAGNDLDLENPSNRVTLNTWLKKARAVVLGPGLGLFDVAQRSVHHALDRAAREGVPVVVDADALTALSQRRDLISRNLVLTPHAREFKTLTGRDLPADPDARAEAAKAAAKELGGTWLVKGPIDVVTDGARVKRNATGHPAMSVGGTGDALAGVVGCLLSKGMSPFDAARVGARLTGEAGERAARVKSWGLLATDVVEAIPDVLAASLPTRADIKHGIQ